MVISGDCKLPRNLPSVSPTESGVGQIIVILGPTFAPFFFTRGKSPLDASVDPSRRATVCHVRFPSGESSAFDFLIPFSSVRRCLALEPRSDFGRLT